MFLGALILTFSYGAILAQETTTRTLPTNDIKYEIVGGIKAVQNEFPHIAALAYGNESPPTFLCGGFLISEQYVLTAAHCIRHPQLGPVKFVRLGANSIEQVTDKTQEIPIADFISYPNYNPPSTYHDIALMKLQKKANFSNDVFPARLQFTRDIDQSVKELITAGWGQEGFAGVQPGDLLKVSLNIANRSRCEQAYGSTKYKEKLPRGFVNSIQLCAGGVKGKDSCQGDSGGPLEYAVGKDHYVVGITSIGKACGLTDIPAIYTRVSAYFPWIQGIVWP